MNDLSARLRDILREGRASGPPGGHPARGTEAPALDLEGIATTLGGRPIESALGPCVVVERFYGPDGSHGRDRVTDYRVADAASLRLLSGRTREDDARPTAGRLVFFDLETTGLGGGAGTCAFLVGCGEFARGGFQTRQFFLTSLSHERAMLTEAARCLTEADTVVSFNGKSFDAPMMENRWAFHRMTATLEDVHHLDMLHASRRLWRGSRRAATGGAWPDAGGPSDATRRCTLGALEHEVLGVTRVGDPEGFEIPSIYFDYVRTGATDRLEPVLEHNRLDLLSLAGLTSRAVRLVRDGPDVADTPGVCLGLGRIYERSGRRDQALQCFARAAGVEHVASVPPGRLVWRTAESRDDRDVESEALCRLARGLRRARRFSEAAEAWERLVETGGPSQAARLEAIEALAVHHEHRTRNLSAARELATRALADRREPRAQDLLRYRLARLDRKLGWRSVPSPLPLDDPPAPPDRPDRTTFHRG